MNRRRILLSYLANSFSWELYSKVYFYNELIPTTINGKNVLNKAKISKIYGNGVIENQLNEYGDMSSTNGYYGISSAATDTTMSLSDGEITFTMNVSGSGLRIASRRNIQIIANHKYLIVSFVKSSVALSGIGQRVGTSTVSSLNNLPANTWTLYSSILSSSVNDLNQSTWYFRTTSNLSVGDTIKMRNAMVIDLTLMFGTGNEPTTLTDNRIQNILNRGYIPYNLGKYKESDIGVVNTTKADTTALDTITFKAQLGGAINSHNTMEITNSAYVFTRNQWKVDLGTLDYQYRSDNTSNLRFISTTLSTMNKLTKPTQPNLLCEGGYTSVSGTYFDNNGSVDKIIRIDDDLGSFVIRNLAYTNSTTFKSSLSGIYAHYPLATPQVISIPRKHLGIVDLGSLNWEYTSGTYSRFTAVVNDIKPVSQVSDIGNIYCSNFITDSVSNIYSHTKDKSIGVHNSTRIWVYDSTYTNATDFKNAMSGTLLFYETGNEVADIENVVDIESGGTITTDSEVLPNIELSVKCK